MSIPSLAIINFSSRDDQEVQDAIRAINRQVAEDFMPIWGAGRRLKLYAPSFDPADPESLGEEKVPADSVIYIVDESTLPGALGFHSINAAEVPIGFVFEDIGDWTVTLSHEVLELIVDPTVNIFVPGPHPSTNRTVLHAYEVCDAVERSTYRIDDVEVSNFVTPQYFRDGDALGTRNDFLGVGVKSFGVTAGSHLGIIDLESLEFETVFGREEEPEEMLGLMAKRRAKYAHKRPERCDEDLCALLDKYNVEPPMKNAHPILGLAGVTRKSRYEAAAAMYRQARTGKPTT